MDGQDWETVIVKRRGTALGAEAHKAISAGAAVARRVDAEEFPVAKKTLGPESRQLIIATRLAFSWNQTQLNTQCAFPTNTIRDIESAKLCPTPTQLNILNRVLKLALKYAPVAPVAPVHKI